MGLTGGCALASLADLRDFYRDQRVLITGHTGFKGSWLCLWLQRLGADVAGIALAPDQGPDNLFDAAQVAAGCTSTFGSICDQDAVAQAFERHQPTVVFHLAARALVQQGYDDPVATFATNTLGTAVVLQAARACPSVKSVACVTTDKVYRNREWPWPYRETDELGGYDPYSASKAAAELVARAFRSLLSAEGGLAIATARGGNVLGGGDWSPHRLVPDIVRAVRDRSPLLLRYPRATRPWQHVLDVNYAYLLLGHRLAGLKPAGELAREWNIGPATDAELSVDDLVRRLLDCWGESDFPMELATSAPYEAMSLRLDPSQANRGLGWRPLLNAHATVDWTAEWYRAYLDDPSCARAITDGQLTRYEEALESSRELERAR